MTPAELRVFCLSFNAVTEEQPFPRNPEVSTFKVLGKIFAITALEETPLTVALKAEPEIAVQLREQHPGVIVPGYHLNKRHWNSVTVDELPGGTVRELIEDSYDLVVAGLPQAERLRLDRG